MRRRRGVRVAWALAAGLAWVPPAPAASGPGEMVLVPAGPFLMGSDRVDRAGRAREYGSRKPWYLDEHPARRVELPAFWIDRTEVTNAQYRRFVREANYWVPPAWEANGYLLTREVLEHASVETLRRLAAERFRVDADTRTLGKEALLDLIAREQARLDDLPVTGVTWFNARDYCRWAGKRLPTEAEWEKAARGTDGREFPWGGTWDPTRLNASGVDPRGRPWPFGLAPVGSYPQGASPYGVLDMAGNVMEWVADWYGPYPGADWRSPDYGERYKVVRGGGWSGFGHYALSHFYRAAYRFYLPPDRAYRDTGFRCARDARPAEGPSE